MKDISLNFGAIKDSVLRLTSAEIIKEGKSHSLDKLIKTVKQSPVLNKQQIVYKNFEQCKTFDKERLAERFINQNISIFRNVKWEDILRENRDLRLTMLSNSHVEATGGKNTKLFESVSVLIESVTRRGFVAWDKEQEAYEYILSHLTTKKEITENSKSKETDDAPNLKSWKFITKIAVNNFNERYDHLNEEEKNILNILISDDNKKINYIEDLKAENLELINSFLKESTEFETEKKDLLESFKNKIENMNHINVINADEYIFSCLDLKDSLNELKK